jgi:hypothetical protein
MPYKAGKVKPYSNTTKKPKPTNKPKAKPMKKK